MPVALTDNSVRFPTGFAPWYVYKVTLVASPNTFEYGDILLSDASGTFDFDITTNGELNLVTGYAMALEPFVTGMTEVQVAVPGSVLPFIAGSTTIQPEELVKINSATGGIQTIVPADAADLAAGDVLGRFRNHHFNNEILRLTATADIINVLTGVL